MLKRPLLLLFLATMISSFAKADVSSAALKTLKETVQRYQKSSLVQMKVEKKVTSELLGSDRTYSGSIALANRRFRLETAEPDKSLVVYDGRYLWTVQYPPQGFDGKVQVARAKLDKKNQNQVLLSDLLVGNGVLTHFNFLSEKADADKLELSAKPKHNEEQISDLKITLDKKSKEITEVNYADELGNRTVMKFTEIKMGKKAKPQIFEYKPEKGAEVTDL